MSGVRKNLYLISSCIRPSYPGLSAYSEEERFAQTLQTIDSIRCSDANAEIILYDSSAIKLINSSVAHLQRVVEHYCYTGGNEHLSKLSSGGFKSPAECMSTYLLLEFYVRKNIDYGSYGRVFKISGRYCINDSFDLSMHINTNARGKYVFKKSKPSWMSSPTVPCFYETRLYSFCPSLFDRFVGLLPKAYETMCNTGLDIEHVFYDLLPRKLVLELDVVGVEGLMGPGNTIQQYLDTQNIVCMDDGKIKLFD